MRRGQVRSWLAGLLVVLAGLLSACGGDSDAGTSGDKSSAPGCGLVSPSLVSKAVTSGTVTSGGTGITKDAQLKSGTDRLAECTVSTDVSDQNFLRITVRTPSRRDLSAYRDKSPARCKDAVTMEDDRAKGSSCVVSIPGGQATELWSLWTDRVVTVAVGRADRAQPADAVLAADIARSVDRHLG